jgi:catechol 2,3-dioxygenase-like lactoylglutathione lyase family enzyme
MFSWSASTLVFVRDVDASIRFYVSRLGFTLNMRHEEAGHALVAGVSRGDGCALLLTSQWPDRIGLGILYAAFAQDQFDALRAELESKQVAVKQGWWGSPLLIVEDGDGNQFYFAKNS